jgi:cation transport ATPase
VTEEGAYKTGFYRLRALIYILFVVVGTLLPKPIDWTSAFQLLGCVLAYIFLLTAFYYAEKSEKRIESIKLKYAVAVPVALIGTFIASPYSNYLLGEAEVYGAVSSMIIFFIYFGSLRVIDEYYNDIETFE